MSVTGLCQICESAEAQFQCDRCGSLVCRTHYDTATGFCTECATEAAPKETRGERGPR